MWLIVFIDARIDDIELPGLRFDQIGIHEEFVVGFIDADEGSERLPFFPVQIRNGERDVVFDLGIVIECQHNVPVVIADCRERAAGVGQVRRFRYRPCLAAVARSRHANRFRRAAP